MITIWICNRWPSHTMWLLPKKTHHVSNRNKRLEICLPNLSAPLRLLQLQSFPKFYELPNHLLYSLFWIRTNPLNFQLFFLKSSCLRLLQLQSFRKFSELPNHLLCSLFWIHVYYLNLLLYSKISMSTSTSASINPLIANIHEEIDLAVERTLEFLPENCKY